MAMKNSSHLVEILCTTERRPHSKIVIMVEFLVFSSTHRLNPLRLFGYQMSLKTVAGWQLWLTSCIHRLFTEACCCSKWLKGSSWICRPTKQRLLKAPYLTRVVLIFVHLMWKIILFALSLFLLWPRPKNSQLPDSKLTKVVDAVGVRTGLVLLDELEVVWRLVDDYACVLAAVVDDLPQAVPCMLLHLELGGIHVLHLHHLCAVRELVHPRHACQCLCDAVDQQTDQLRSITMTK